MPEFAPAPGTVHCVADGRAIFLDTSRDRYFCLAREAERAFLADMRGEPIAQADRDRLRGLVKSGVLVAARARADHWYREPARAAARDIWNWQRQAGSLRELSSIFLSEIAITRRKRTVPFDKLLEELAARKLMSRDGADDLNEMVRIGWVSESLGLFRSAEDRCFVRSYAVARLIFAKGIPAQLIFGVSGRPFKAHCWVQYGDAVLTDRLENIAQYTPILAI